VTLGVDLLQPGDTNLSIEGRGVGFAMAEELLNVAAVGSVLEEVGGTGVAQEMGASFGDVGGSQDFADVLAEPFGRERFAETCQKEAPLLAFENEAGAHFLEVAVDPVEGTGADGHKALFVSLRFANVDGEALVVEILDVQAAKFPTAHGGGVKGFEHRAVADAEKVGGVGHAHDDLDLAHGEGFGRELVLGAREFKFTGGVGHEDPFFYEPAEVVLDDVEFYALSVDSHGFAVGLAVSPEPGLVALEVGNGDLADRAEAAFDSPPEEAAQGLLAPLDGVFRVGADGEVFEVDGPVVMKLVRVVSGFGKRFVANATEVDTTILGPTTQEFPALKAFLVITFAHDQL